MCIHRDVEHRTRSYTDNSEVVSTHKEVLKDLEYIWGCYPDLRLGKLLCYIASEVLGTSDPFYLEDSKYQTFRDTVADRYSDI
nr:MAG TPA: Protein of unknown function (DUF1040) [Bacteriophage sp.]